MSTRDYKQLQEAFWQQQVTNSEHKPLEETKQGTTRDYKGLQGTTRDYKGQQATARDLKQLPAITSDYKQL